ncbi:MAG: hypothetical protein WC789_06980 [Lentisphaeria bacterium]
MRESVRFQSLERADLLDMDALADDLLRTQLGQVVDAPLTNPARQRLWVLSGFAMTNPAAKQLQVARGRGLLGTRVDGVVEYGLITTDGDLTKTVDLNAYAPGTYEVYIRFERVQGGLESRAFWDPSGGGSEYSQAVNSRWTANWSVRVEAGSPGAEWLLIGEVDQATMVITDMRPFFFEGDPSVAYRSGWSVDGGGVFADRSVDRATYGVGDLQMFSAAVRQCLEDIKGRGLRRWWERDIGGMNIGFDAAPVEDELAVGDANFRLSLALAAQPRIYFNATDYLDFTRGDDWYHFVVGGVVELEVETGALGPGTAGKSLGMAGSGLRWGTAFLDDLDLNQVDGHGVIGDLKPATDDTESCGTAARRWEFLRVSKDILADRDIQAGNDVIALGGLFGVTLELTGVVTSNLTSNPTGTYSLGTDLLRWKELFLTDLLDIEAAATAYSRIYGGAAAANNRFWQWVIGASGELVLQGGTDAGAGLFDLLGIDRSGVTAGSAMLYIRGGLTTEVDSGYPATWNPAAQITGVNPILRLEDDDPTIDPECSMWGIWSRKGTGDNSILAIGCGDSTGAMLIAGRGIEFITRGGGALQHTVDYITMRATQEVKVEALLAISLDPGPPVDPLDVGLCNDFTLGAAGGGTGTIKFAVAAGANDTTGFLKIYVNGTARYVPFFDVN